MRLDIASVVAINTIIECLAGALFLGQALLHRHSRAARIWALAFLASILTTVCYLAWAVAPEAWIGNALGNAAFAVGVGCLWLGAARYNNARMTLRVAIVVGAGVVAFVASVFDVRDPWAGSAVLFGILAILAALGAVEARRGKMGRRPFAIGLTVVLAVTALWELLRLGLLIAYGPSSEVFETWAGSVNAGILTAALSIVALTSTVVLVSEEDLEAAPGDDGSRGLGRVLGGEAFARLTDEMSARAASSGTEITVLALVIPDFGRIREAFGSAEAETLERRFHERALGRIDPIAPVATAGPGRVVAALSGRSLAAAEQAARSAHRLVAEDLATASGTVVPLLGAGLAVGRSGRELVAEALRAAEESAASEDAPVVVTRIEP
ncbi:MAG TPA: hypothetical protein VNR37_06830 [Microbacteriaceae bacterium]|nr:hypothetical protein [Microbacteriaceae bacterium]